MAAMAAMMMIPQRPRRLLFRLAADRNESPLSPPAVLILPPCPMYSTSRLGEEKSIHHSMGIIWIGGALDWLFAKQS
jgi:hypothetical protein